MTDNERFAFAMRLLSNAHDRWKHLNEIIEMFCLDAAEPRTWIGLTDAEMHECWDSPLTPLGMKHARMIEAKLKEKNT